jgi:tetratricopeptide (TPR) repeat protein
MKQDQKKIPRLPLLILLILLLLRFVPYLAEDGRLWGVNHLIFLPPIYTILFIVIAALALTLPFIPAASQWSGQLIQWFGRVFYESPRKYIHRLIFVAVMIGLFIIFRAPTHFLGDGYAALSNLASSTGTFVKWTEKGVTLILLAVQSLFGPQNQQTALMAYQTVSIASGAIVIWFYFLIAEVITEDNTRRLLVFGSSLLSGSLLLFFGYVENYPMLWIGLTGFTYFGLRHLKQGAGIIPATLFLLFGLFIHLQEAVFIPAFIYLIFCRGKGLELYRRYRMLFRCLAGAIALTGFILFIKLYNSNLFFEGMFLPLFSGKPYKPSYGIFSFPHLIDLINQLLLLSPLIILFLVLALKNLSGLKQNKAGVFLALTGLCGLIFITIIDPTLGMPRDWDLFSLGAYGLTLLLIIAISSRTIAQAAKLIIPIAVLLAISPLPYLITNLNETASTRYIKYIIDLDRENSYGTLYALSKYYQQNGDKRAADSLDVVYNSGYLNQRMIECALDTLKKGGVAGAREIAAHIRPDKFSAAYHNLLSLIFLWDKKYQRALDESALAIELQPYNYAYYMNRARIYSIIGQEDKALENLHRSNELNAGNPEIMEGYASLYMRRRQYDSSIQYARRMIAADSLRYAGYYILCKSHAALGQWPQVRKNADDYKRLGKPDPLFESRRQELEQLVSNLK